MIMRTLGSLSLLLLSANMAAADISPIARVIPAPLQGTVLQASQGTAPANGTLVFSNTSYNSGWYTSSPGTNSALDDLHMTAGGVLSGFDFGYNKTTAGTAGATITFYANDANNTAPSVVVAGPYAVTGLPSGTNAWHVDVTDAKVIGKDVWMGVAFTTTSTGHLVYSPPTIGTSADFWYQFAPTAGYNTFGGNPKANFYCGVYTVGATPVAPATWGGIKSLFR